MSQTDSVYVHTYDLKKSLTTFLSMALIWLKNHLFIVDCKLVSAGQVFTAVVMVVICKIVYVFIIIE